MFLELSPADSPKGRTSGLSLKNLSTFVSIPFMSLDLTPGAGNLLGVFYWEILSPWRGESLTLNTGASPRDAAVSTLWQILEDKPHPRYYLTRKACLGILRRASERGKPLPEQLGIALEIQAGLRKVNYQSVLVETGAFGSNQRNEEGNLHTALSDGGGQVGQGDTRVFAAGFCGESSKSARGIGYQEECAPTLKAVERGPSIMCLNDQGGQVMDCTENITERSVLRCTAISR